MKSPDRYGKRLSPVGCHCIQPVWVSPNVFNTVWMSVNDILVMTRTYWKYCLCQQKDMHSKLFSRLWRWFDIISKCRSMLSDRQQRALMHWRILSLLTKWNIGYLMNLEKTTSINSLYMPNKDPNRTANLLKQPTLGLIHSPFLYSQLKCQIKKFWSFIDKSKIFAHSRALEPWSNDYFVQNNDLLLHFLSVLQL